MNLERFIAALGPAEVVNGGRRAPVEIADLAYDARTVGPGALFFCVPRTQRRRARLRRGRGRARARRRSSSSAPLPLALPAARRRRRPRGDAASRRSLFFGDPSRELERRRRSPARTGRRRRRSCCTRSSRRPAAATGLLTNIERRVGGERAPDRAQHARGDRPAAAAARDGRRRRPRLRARGDLRGRRRRAGSTGRASPCSSSRT